MMLEVCDGCLINPGPLLAIGISIGIVITIVVEAVLNARNKQAVLQAKNKHIDKINKEINQIVADLKK